MLTLKHRLMTAQEVAEYRAVPRRWIGPQPMFDAMVNLRLLFIRIYNEELRAIVRESKAQW